SIAKHRRVRDLLQSVLVAKPAGMKAMYAISILAVLELLELSETYRPRAHLNLDGLYLAFIAIPAIALLLTLLARRWQKGISDAHTLSRAKRRFVAFELALLAIVIAALPAIGFTRIVQVALNVKAAERWLETVDDRWTARQARVVERVHDPNYAPDTRALLLRGYAAIHDPLDPAVNFSYLNLLETVESTEMLEREDVVPATGQSRVRKILDWNILASRDEPGANALQVSRRHHQVSLRGADGRLALTSVNVSVTSRGMSDFGIVLGFGILAAAIGGVYWARGRILWPAGGKFPRWNEYLVPQHGKHAVLVIGPPKTGKDELVHGMVDAVARIRLLDRKLTEDGVTKYLQRVEDAIKAKSPERDKTVWILVSNLETHLVDQECRRLVLKLLEGLLISHPDHPRGVVVTTSVDPIAHFQEVFSEERVGIYTDDAPEVSLSRAALLLSRFERRYVPLATLSKASCRHAWDSWWHYKPSNWEAAVNAELEGLKAIVELPSELKIAFDDKNEVPFGDLVRDLQRRANAYYELLWTSCTRKEKLVLIQLAQEGFVTAQSWDVVAALVAKGLVVERPVPTIFNQTFRNFLVNIERNGVIEEWERLEGNGLWQVSGRLIGASLLAGGLFYLLTQDFNVQSLLPIVSGTGMFGAPLFRTIVARMSGKSLDATV
ncbi:MAG TPA: hypothetical protein VFS23_10530, partial [Vicinamibacterales bacterium]|nr:hypothetical protein [Vicinamibacterales bacterium]